MAQPIISIIGHSVVEDAGGIRYINFDITLSEPSAQTVQVSFRTIAGTALSGIDYQEDFGTITFAAGQTSTPSRSASGAMLPTSWTNTSRSSSTTRPAARCSPAASRPCGPGHHPG